jgi:cytochrome P450
VVRGCPRGTAPLGLTGLPTELTTYEYCSPAIRPTDGLQIETGENILVAAHLANRDGRAFAEPDGFILDRDFDREPHIGKRCVASLARMLCAACCMLHVA